MATLAECRGPAETFPGLGWPGHFVATGRGPHGRSTISSGFKRVRKVAPVTGVDSSSRYILLTQ
jgi:hypothetical protein